MPNDKPLRIALTGRMRSGKSTVATRLAVHYDMVEEAFGTALKHLADHLFGDSTVYKNEYVYTENTFTGSREVAYVRKPRKLYQDVGQALRALDETVWIRQVERSIEYAENKKSTRGVVVSDLRQQNEYDWARDNGFIIIRVESDEDTRIERMESAGDDYTIADLAHETELLVDGFDVDYTINNDGNYDELVAQIDEIMSEIIPTP